MSVLPSGWIVDLEFFHAGTFSFVKTSDGWFAGADEGIIWGVADFIETIQGDNHLKEEAQSVSFREPEISSMVVQSNETLQKCLDAINGETILDCRFIKYCNFFLDTENDLKPVGLLAVANNLFLKDYSEDHGIISLFMEKGDEK